MKGWIQLISWITRHKKILIIALSVLSVCIIVAASFGIYKLYNTESITVSSDKRYIKWVEFNVTYPAMEKAMSMDIKTYNQQVHLNWIELLSYLGTKYGGDFKKYKSKDLDKIAARIKNGETIEQIMKDSKYYKYYFEAYSAILGNFLGEYEVQEKDPENSENKIWVKKYGLKVFSPIAKGYGFSHYDDFGDGRSFGYARKHLGNDLMGNIGTPIVAVESGRVEAMGWNMYGGWRIGIRSFDNKRYYYYAHLRKDKPFHSDLYVGKTVKAGDVIGYLGMTGYSTRENVNNITTPHLHFGMQLIFDESQKESNNEIWIDVYNIVNLLQKNRSAVVKDEETRDYYRNFELLEPSTPSSISLGDD